MELRSMQSWCRCRWWQCVYALWLEFTHHVLSACVHLSISVCEWNHLGVLLSLWDPHLIAKIPSNPRAIPYRFSNSVPTILWDSDTMLTKPPNSEHPPSPPMHYFHSPRIPNDLGEPRSHSCLHLSSSFHFSPLELWTRFLVLVSVFTFPFSIY